SSQYVGWKSDVLVEPIRQPSSKLKVRVLNTYKKQDRIKFEKKRNPLVLTPTIGAMIVAALLFLFFQYESPANKNHLTNTADAAVYELKRSEERRVGKECRSKWTTWLSKKTKDTCRRSNTIE